MKNFAPMPAHEVLETTLMCAAIDFAIAYERKDRRMMAIVVKSVTMLLNADEEFTKNLMLRREKSFSQMTEDLKRAGVGLRPITPGTPKS